jgi:hypothetical protein
LSQAVAPWYSLSSSEPQRRPKIWRRSPKSRASCDPSVAAARLRLAIPVRLVSTRATEPAVLLDLSRSGARTGLEQSLALGACLYFKVAKRDLFAAVVRPDLGEGGGINGLVFDEPLADDVVLMVRRFAETLEQNERDSLRDKVRHWVSGQDRI